jgi:hypothetical protein
MLVSIFKRCKSHKVQYPLSHERFDISEPEYPSSPFSHDTVYIYDFQNNWPDREELIYTVTASTEDYVNSVNQKL